MGDERLTTANVLEKYTAGPDTGVFVDGFCEPNPGRGGWGCVKVAAGVIVAENNGGEAQTTNNRMEMRALIEGMKLMSVSEPMTIYTDSQLCLNTLTQWASGWEAKGWRKKGGPIANLDLVQEAFDIYKTLRRPPVTWVKGHAGIRWNEYADALSRSAFSQ